jgi:predicted  nucleic acid-binding Zn-ribbon protein
MMRDLAPRLAVYHRLVRELAGAHARLAGVPEEMRALHDEYTAARGEIDSLAALAEEAKRERIAREGAVAEAQEKLRKFQQQVPMVRNQREYGALLTEIDTAKASLRSLEEAVLETLERAETAARSLEERRAGFADVEARHATALAEWEAKKPEVAAEARGLEREIAALREELPKPLVVSYGRLAERYRGEALAPLARVERAGGSVLWACSSCNFQVRSQVALEIRTHGAVVQCDGCRRFLYAEDGA